MNLLKQLILLFISAITLFSCNPLKQLQTEQVAAEKSYTEKNYAQAYTQLSVLIKKLEQNNQKVPNALILKAAESASEISNYSAATDYYKKNVSDSASVEAVKGLIKVLNAQELHAEVADELSKHKKLLTEKGEEDYLKQQVFNNNVDLNKKDAVITSFKELTKPTEDQAMIYINTLENAGNKKEALKYCKQLVKSNPNFYKAREWKGKYYYEYAENWYKNEMNKYNKDKNYTAYVYLKRELKKISANYKVAKEQFEILHKQYSTDKKYIKYLKNIYLRLELKKEATAMDNLLK